MKIKDELVKSIEKINKKIHAETLKIDDENVDLVIGNLMAEEEYDEFHLNNTEQKDPRYGEGRDVFTSVAQARRRADQLGCSGHHTIRGPERNFYMPCDTHGVYLRVTNSKEDKKLSARMQETINGKVKEHNEKYGDRKGKRVTRSMLEKVFNRGIGAYRTNPESVRRTVMGPEQWAIARVNAFLFAVRTGRYRRGRFDRDLLPSGHPLKSSKDKKDLV
jgi:hypothetical protein